jgi:hypothetical protein
LKVLDAASRWAPESTPFSTTLAVMLRDDAAAAAVRATATTYMSPITDVPGYE